MRLIDADELIPLIKMGEMNTYDDLGRGRNGGIDFAINRINQMPTIEERKRGEWLELTNTNHTYVCSVCGRMLVNITDGKNMVTKNYPFCHCGADMRESHCDDCRFYDEECVYCPVKQERREE